MNTIVKWVGGTALAAGLVTAMLVPSEPSELLLQARGDTLGMNYSAARSRLLMLRRVVGRGEALELARGVSGVRPDVPLVRVGRGIAPPSAQAIEKQVRDELVASKALPTKYPIAVIAEIDTTVPLGMSHTLSVVLPQSPGAPCTVVLRLANNRTTNWVMTASQRLLSTCAFYAAYGQPGDGMQQYLTETRGITARWIRLPPMFTGSEEDLTTFRISGYGWSDIVEATLRCRVGVLEACDRIVGPEAVTRDYSENYFYGAIPDTLDRSPLRTEYPGVDVVNSAGWWNEHRIRAGAMAELAQELGPERFGAIWRDPRGLRAAYESRAGRPFVEWVSEYVAARVAPHSRGPSIPAFSVIVALTLLAAGAGLAVLRAPRTMS